MNFLKDLRKEVLNTAKFNLTVFKRSSSGETEAEVVHEIAAKGQLPATFNLALDDINREE